MSLNLFSARKAGENNMAEELFKELGVKVRKEDTSKKDREYSEWINPESKTVSESVLDPVHDTLAKDVWTDDEEHVKEKHRSYILDKLYEWLDIMDVESEPSKIAIVGSITTYQYTDTSDIDVNVVIDIDDEKRKELLKFLPNETLLPDTKHPVNFYISKDAESNIEKKDSAYDLLNDKWIKRPKPSDVIVPYSYVLEIAKFFMDGIDERIAEYERDKIELELYKEYMDRKDIAINKSTLQDHIEGKEVEIRADLDAIYTGLKMVKSFRNKAFEEDYEPKFMIKIETDDPDFSINNLVYKVIERFGYLDKLKKYKDIREDLLEKDKE